MNYRSFSRMSRPPEPAADDEVGYRAKRRAPRASLGARCLLPVGFAHPGLDLRHAGDPAIVIFSLLAHVAEHLRVRQDHKSLLLDPPLPIDCDLRRRLVA